jgi:hypothetical protein
VKKKLKQHNILNQAEELAKIGSWEYNIKTKNFYGAMVCMPCLILKRQTSQPAIYRIMQ